MSRDQKLRAARADIDRLKKHLAAKDQKIADIEAASPVWLRRISADVPSLPRLLAGLRRAVDAAEPGRGYTIDSSPSGERSPLSSDGRSTVEGRATLSDRRRLERLARKVDGLADLVDRDLAPQTSSATSRKGPQCWQDDCPRRSVPQSWDADVCGWCGRPFTPWTPRKTKEER